jgi:hypothetical protein
VLNALDHQLEQLDRGWVDPVSVLEDHQNRPLGRETFELPDQRIESSHLLYWRS